MTPTARIATLEPCAPSSPNPSAYTTYATSKPTSEQPSAPSPASPQASQQPNTKTSSATSSAPSGKPASATTPPEDPPSQTSPTASPATAPSTTSDTETATPETAPKANAPPPASTRSRTPMILEALHWEAISPTGLMILERVALPISSDCSIEDVAKEMGCSPKNISRLMDRLRDEIVYLTGDTT